MALAIIEARRKAHDNRDRYARLAQRHTALQNRVAEEELRQDVLRARIHCAVLEPVTAALSQLGGVHLADFDDFEMPGVRAMPVIDLVSDLEATLAIVRALARGARWGAGAAAGSRGATLAGVGALGTASTGTPISALSGAAADNATRAFLGGGSRAAGGLGMRVGTGVLRGIGVVPAVVVGAGVVTVMGRRDLRDQHEKERQLGRDGVRLDRDQERFDAVLRRAEHIRQVLRRLLEAGLDGLDDFTATIEDHDEVGIWSATDRARVAAMVSLAVVTSGLMRAPLVGEDGAVADRDGGALADAHRWLHTYHDGGAW